MKYDFNTVPDRRGTSSYKFDRRAGVFGRPDVIPMWVADMDFAVPPAVDDAIKRRAAHPVYGYEYRDDAYYDAIVGWNARRNGWPIEREWIGFTPGVVTGLVLAVRSLCKEGDGVVIQPPVYPPFAETVRSNGRRVVANPLRVVGGRWTIDFDDLDRKLAGARVFMLCNPHNPTGRVFTREELLRVGELCVKHDVWTVSDEIHSDLIRPGLRHTPLASLSPEIARRTVTLMAPSKTFNVAGLSSACSVIADRELFDIYNGEVERNHVGGGTTFGNAALTAAYGGACDEWLDQLMDYIAGNVDYVKSFLAHEIPSVGTYDWEGTYLLWLDFSRWGMADSRLREFMVNEAGLGLNDGLAFGREGSGHMRMNLGTTRATVERAMEQLLKAAKNPSI